MSTTTPPQLPPGGNVDIGWKLEVGCTVTFGCAAIVVALRCFTRWKYSKKGWDDYLMIIALLQALAATILDYVAVDAGLGRHTVYLTYDNAVRQEYYILIAQVFCVQALSFAKLSIIASYLRVLRGSGTRVHQVLLWSMGFLILAVNTMIVITFYAACTPNRKTWDPLTKGTCWSVNKRLAFYLLQGAFSGFSDFFLAFYPLCFLYKLKISTRTKAVVMGLMSLGAVTGVFAIIRTVETGTELNPPPNATPDTSYISVSGLLWSGMERNIAIMLGSIPALNPLVAPTSRFIKETLGSSRSRSSSSKPWSHQLTSTSDRSDLPEYSYQQKPYSMHDSRKSSAPTYNTSEELILPIHGTESRC